MLARHSFRENNLPRVQSFSVRWIVRILFTLSSVAAAAYAFTCVRTSGFFTRAFQC